ncbi:hypothetical protein M9H77_29780 [Catharanthus roseus]|uniref:Uncharacterized protein n=1 Tax=Catharanthus roseus TaxID=4058 RepID=A0ACB9ZXL8_CATRO|nr:hypothetical protein M9H77_29780 [Catharanthus roseus]
MGYVAVEAAIRTEMANQRLYRGKQLLAQLQPFINELDKDHGNLEIPRDLVVSKGSEMKYVYIIVVNDLNRQRIATRLVSRTRASSDDVVISDSEEWIHDSQRHSKPPKPRRSFALGLNYRTPSPLARIKYSSPSSTSAATSSITSDSLSNRTVYVRGHVIDFSPANIANYISYPHYSDIEGTGLEEEGDYDELAKVLTVDAGAIL